MRFRSIFAAASALLLVHAVACGGTQTEGTVHGVAPSRVVEAPAPSVASYGTTVSDGPTLGSDAELVRRAVEEAAATRRTELVGDGRLALLAAWVAERLGEGATSPPPEVLEFFARHLGLVEPRPHLIILGNPDAAQLERGLTDSVLQFLARQPYNRWGGTVTVRQGLKIAVVALSASFLEMEPVPRSLDPGAQIRVRGRVAAPYRQLSFAVAKPSGEVERVEAGPGPDYELAYAADETGEYRVELLAEGNRGVTVLANFPVYVGVPVPSSVTLEGEEAGGTSGDVESVATELLRLINRSRREAGLNPLETHEGVAGVADRHSRDQVENEFIGHDSPTTGTAAERVERAGYHTGLVLENIGRGYSANEIHQGMLESPGHRANVLNRDVTHVGIGVVMDPEGSRPAFVATEVFVRMSRAIDVAAAPGRVLELLNESRRARGAPPLVTDENLQEVAQRGAERFFSDQHPSRQDVVDQASSDMRRFGIMFSRIGGVMAVVSDVEEAGRLEPALDQSARSVGIGVAQGTRPEANGERAVANGISIVIMLGWPR